MGKNSKTVYDPDLVEKLRTKLLEESIDPTSLSVVGEHVFGGGPTGKSLLHDARNATHHVNGTLQKINQGFDKYYMGFKNLGKHMQETDDQKAADAQLFTAGLGLINKPFYQNRHGAPNPLLGPLLAPFLPDGPHQYE